MLHNEIQSGVMTVKAGTDFETVVWYTCSVSSGTRSMKNIMGKAASGRSCFRALQYWSPVESVSYLSLQHVLWVMSFITMATMAKAAIDRRTIAGASQRANPCITAT